MGLVGGLMGNAGAVDPARVAQEMAKLFGPGEQVQAAYSLVRDMFVFTDRRLLITDVQGVTGRKTEYMSIPYHSIVRFAVESAGTFDLEAELKIWLSSTAEPIVRQFNRKVDIYDVQARLAYHAAL